MPKMKLGAAVYALVAILLFVSAVLTARHTGPYSDVYGVPLIATVVVVAATGLMFVVGAVTRRGLVAADGPWLCRNGWMIVVGLTAAGFLVSVAGDMEASPFPTGPSLFVPPWIRRCQEKYYEGRAEAERELNPGQPDEGRSPTA